MKLEPIDNWKESWRFASIQWSALGIVLMGILEAINQTWITLPSYVLEKIPNHTIVATCLFIAVMIGRVLLAVKSENKS